MDTWGKAIVDRRKTVLAAWIAVLVGLMVTVGVVGPSFTDVASLPPSESSDAYDALESLDSETASGRIAWTSLSDVDGPLVQDQAARLLSDVERLPGVITTRSPYDDPSGAQIDTATDTAYAVVVLDPETASIADIQDAASAHATEEFAVTTGGSGLTEDPGGEHGPEIIGMLAALIILVVVFRSAWAAVLPLVTGVAGVAVSLMGVILAGHVMSVSEDYVTMAALIGLGVGIDYALFIVSRYRHARAQGANGRDATGRAIDTAGRAVVFAGVTVALALVAMFLLGMTVLTGMALAGAVTVLVTVVAAVTLLPALMGMLGDRLLSRRERRAMRAGTVLVTIDEQVPDGGLARRWQRGVATAPWLAIIGVAAVAVVGILPFFSMEIGRADASAQAEGTEQRDYFDMVTPAFGAGLDATIVVVAQPKNTAEATDFDALVRDIRTTDGVASVQSAPAQAGDIAVAAVTPETSAGSEQSRDLVRHLRDVVVTDAMATSGLTVNIAGETATNIDIADVLMGNLPLYFAVVAVIGFLLLAMAFRSVAVPVVGVATAIMSILFGIGVTVAVFQFGWGIQLFGIGDTGAPILYMVPVLAAGIVFGLATDYQVFLVSRIQEEWLHSRDGRGSVTSGARHTTRVIAAAALIMISVFASFAMTGERAVAQIGVTLASAVLFDAFFVRLTLVPAIMRLLADKNWSYPRWAERVTPRLSVEGPVEGHVNEREPALVRNKRA